MKAEKLNAYRKYIVIKHALKEKNVKGTCKLYGISRTTFYNWKRAYQKSGMAGLETKIPKKPQMPNRVSQKVEAEILAHIARYPADGPQRIYYELKTRGIGIGESGIYNVLRRHHLTRRAQREEFAQNKALQTRKRQEGKKVKLAIKNPTDSFPGHLMIQRMAYMGNFEGIGRVYQYSIYDTYSQWGAVKLYNRKQDIEAWDFFELKIVYLMKTLHLEIQNLLTEKSKEFLPYYIKGDKGKEVLERQQIHHLFAEPGEHEAMDKMAVFNEYLVREFYSKIGAEVQVYTFAQLQHAMNRFLRKYNFSKKIGPGNPAGKAPVEVVLEQAALNDTDFDTLPLWLMALIAPLNRGESNDG